MSPVTCQTTARERGLDEEVLSAKKRASKRSFVDPDDAPAWTAEQFARPRDGAGMADPHRRGVTEVGGGEGYAPG